MSARSAAQGPLSRRFDRWVRSLTYYQAGRRTPVSTPVSEEPEPDERVERTARLVGVVVAVAAPIVVCLAMVPVREDIDRSTAALVLVLPVVLVAVIGGPAAATVAAVVSSLAFDVLLTRPYYRIEIHTAEDIEATLILLVVGVGVAQLVARETRSRVRSTARGDQLDALVAMVAAASRRRPESELADRAAASLAQLLDLRHCHWSSGYHGEAHPVLTRSGEIAREWSSNPDRAPLPATGVELPVTGGGRELGRFVLVPASAAPVSREERLVAVAIADAFGLALAGRDR